MRKLYLCNGLRKKENETVKNYQESNMNTNELGFVYLPTNTYFREGLIKIGKSSRPVDGD